jgi:hypothetical protein
MFAKLFNLKTAQVLVEKDYTGEYILRLTTETNGQKARATLTYHSEEERDSAFAHYNNSLAFEFYKGINKKTK